MATTGPTTTSPFQFLEAYRKEDARAFFGRDRDVRELFERIFLSNMVLLYGASGTGKSSLIRCGLANQFEKNDWLPIYVRRNGSLLSALHRALRRKALTDMAADLSLGQKLQRLYLDYFVPVYLIFDQFEELFIQGDEAEQQAFFRAIADLMQTSDRCKILISMREEYLAQLTDYELVIPNLFANRQRLEPMGRRQLREVIVGNARTFDIALEEEAQTADMIIDRLRNRKGEVELPYLQIYLDQLYQEARRRQADTGGALRFDRAIIGRTQYLQDVLGDFLTRQIEGLESELKQEGLDQKGLPLAVLFSLVTSDRTRKPARVDAVRQAMEHRLQVDPMYVDYCIQKLIDMRILTFKE